MAIEIEAKMQAMTRTLCAILYNAPYAYKYIGTFYAPQKKHLRSIYLPPNCDKMFIKVPTPGWVGYHTWAMTVYQKGVV